MDMDPPPTPFTPITPTDNNEHHSSDTQPNKRRRKKSIVWEHFSVETVGPGVTRACCKQCKKSFAYITGPKLAGTSHLKRHIALGICPVSRQQNQVALYTPDSKPGTGTGTGTNPPKRRYRTNSAFPTIPFDQDRCIQQLAKMIIIDELPLEIVEHSSFVDFVRTLQPNFNMVSVNSVQAECVALYLKEKESLLNVISEIPGHVNLLLDLRTSTSTMGYVYVTAQFIDNEWNLHRRLLSVIKIPAIESEYAFNHAVVACLSDWHLEGKLFTISLDQSFANDTVVENLRGLSAVKNPAVVHGQLVNGECYARVISRLVVDAMESMGGIVRKIRESVKYVKTSDYQEERFIALKDQLQIPSTREIIIDDPKKWDTTYHMLVAACELKEVFSCFDTSDPGYKIDISIDDWRKAEILCKNLKLFYDAASMLTGPTHPTANIFYHEVLKLHEELTHAANSLDPIVSNLARPLSEIFDKYWKRHLLVFAIAVVMDPRFKMRFIEFRFPKHVEDSEMWIKMVDEGLHEIYLDYMPPMISLPGSFHEPNIEVLKIEPPDEDGTVIHDFAKPEYEGHIEEVPLDQSNLDGNGRDVANMVEDTQDYAVFSVENAQIEAVVENDGADMTEDNQAEDEDAFVVDTQDEAVVKRDTENGTAVVVDTKDESALVGEAREEASGERDIENEAAVETHTEYEVASAAETQDEATVEKYTEEVAPVEGENQGEAASEVETHNEAASVEDTQNGTAVEIETADGATFVMDAQEEAVAERDTADADDFVGETQNEEVKKDTETGATSAMDTLHEAVEEKDTQEGFTSVMDAQDEAVEEKDTQDGVTSVKDAHDEAVEEKDTQDGVTSVMDAQDEVVEKHTEDVAALVSNAQDEAVIEREAKDDNTIERNTEYGTVAEIDTANGDVSAADAENQEVVERETGDQFTGEGYTQTEPYTHAEEEYAQNQNQNQAVLLDDTQQRITHDIQDAAEHGSPVYGITYDDNPQIHHQADVFPMEIDMPQYLDHEVPAGDRLQDIHLISTGNGLSDFEVYIQEMTSSQQMKSELDQYLEETVFPRVYEFDILGWWKLNKLKYPTLSRMASDILSIPLSTAAPDSVFDIEIKTLDSYRSSLRPVILEALICAKDWLQHASSSSSSSSSENPNPTVKMEF